MTSILPTIEAKSDQLNAEDLIGGPRSVTITEVRVNTSEDQPVQVHFEGDNGKPFKPCKTMRRLFARVWGDDTSLYVGKSMTLYLDPEVKYRGMKVGGIRISHMSHIEGPRSFYLTETRGQKKQHTVNPLIVRPPEPEADPETVIAAIHELRNCDTMESLAACWSKNKAIQTDADFQKEKDRQKARLLESADNF